MSENSIPDELELLKERARTLGVPFNGNIGLNTLKAKIEAKLNGEAEEAEEEVEVKSTKKKTKAQIEQETRESLRKEKMKLVRCRIYNLNPAKRDLHGEVITVANRFLGTVSKFIPFGEATDGGYHIPQVLYDHLKGRKFQQIKSERVRGQLTHRTRLAPEYNIEVLPPLSKAELQELAIAQAAADRLTPKEDA